MPCLREDHCVLGNAGDGIVGHLNSVRLHADRPAASPKAVPLDHERRPCAGQGRGPHQVDLDPSQAGGCHPSDVARRVLVRIPKADGVVSYGHAAPIGDSHRHTTPCDDTRRGTEAVVKDERSGAAGVEAGGGGEVDGVALNGQ